MWVGVPGCCEVGSAVVISGDDVVRNMHEMKINIVCKWMRIKSCGMSVGVRCKV